MPRQRNWVATLVAATAATSGLLTPDAFAAAARPGAFSCVASGLSVSIAGAAAADPVVAGKATGACANRDASLGAGLPAVVAADAVSARTQSAAGYAAAAGGVVGLSVPFAGLPIAIPMPTLPDSLSRVTIPLGGAGAAVSGPISEALAPVGSLAAAAAAAAGGSTGVASGAPAPATGVVSGATGAVSAATGVAPPVSLSIAGLRSAKTRALLDDLVAGLPASVLAQLPSSVTLDLRPALEGLLPTLKLPALDLVSVRSAFAYARAKCAGGVADFDGAHQVTGLRVLGRDVADGGSFDGSVALIDTASIDPSRADLSKLSLPAGLSLNDAVVGPVLTEAIRTVLRAIPPVAIPATLARVVVIPGAQTRIADGLGQQALRAQVSIAGTEVADLSIGRSAVRGACPRSAARDAPEAALECTKRRLVLVDVLPRDGRVKLNGAADRRYVGRTVSVVFGATGRVVARAKVRRDGSFATTAPMPPRRLRSTNAARYEARIGRERSLDLKLQRRMVLSSIVSRAGKVTITGRVVGPLGSPLRTITLTRRVSCRRSERVARFRPRRDGRFRITVAAPKGRDTAVYRLGTKVRRTTTNPKLFPTFTLPRAVELR